MRVENPSHPEPAASPKKSFADALKKAPAKSKEAKSPTRGDKPQPKMAPATKASPKGPAKSPVANAMPQASSAKQTTRAIIGQHRFDDALARGQDASQEFETSLVERRSDAEVHRPEIKRIADEIAKIVVQDPTPTPVPMPQPLAPQTSPLPVRAEVISGQIAQIIERAELLARAEGPALRLGLSEGSASSIEVVRTGKGEVALRLDARSGTDRRALAAKAGAIREALAKRGLRVRELRVA